MSGTFRIALRLLRKRPGLAAGRLLTVTVVVAAVSSVFTVANATFLRPVPFPSPDRLVRVYTLPPGRTDFASANPLTPLSFERFRQQTTLERLEGIWAADRALTGDGEPEAIPGGRVSAGFFSLFGGRPALGRVFTEEEVAIDAKVVVLSDGLWKRRYGGDPSILGRSLVLDRQPHTVIGVLGPEFEPAFVPSSLWTPLSTKDPIARAALSSVRTFGLLPAGQTMAQHLPSAERTLAELTGETPAILKGWTVGMKDMREAQYGRQGPVLLMLLAAVAGLGLIAISNLANLTLADVMHRRADFSIRAALGATRRDIAATEIAQSAVIAAAGGVGGLASAALMVPLMLSLDSSSGITAAQAPIDWRVALCGFGAAAGVMLAAVAVPVLRLAGPALATDLAAGSRRAIGGRAAQRTRTVLVAAQTALALVLLSSGAQVVYALHQAARNEPGFDPSNVVTAQLRLSPNLFPLEADRARFIERVLDRLHATPGIVAAGSTLHTFTVNGSFTTLVHVEDRPTPDGQAYSVQYRRVSPGYFEAMRIRIVRGRAFDRRDWIDAPLVAIVSRGFARRFWGDGDPIGRHVKRGATARGWSTVVGVVDDVRDVGLDQAPIETIYTPYFQGNAAAAPVGLVIRTAGDPRGLILDIKRAVWQVDATQPLANVVTLEQFLSATLSAQRFRAILIAVCGAIGLLLATIGTYGMTARSVVERRSEVGVRLALGGSRLRVWWTIVWDSLRAVAVGAATGVLVSGGASAALAALLPELNRASWMFAAAAAGLLLTVGGVAAMAAGRGTVAVEPLRALRES